MCIKGSSVLDLTKYIIGQNCFLKHMVLHSGLSIQPPGHATIFQAEIMAIFLLCDKWTYSFLHIRINERN